MSGGHFDYNQYKLAYISDEIRDLLEKNNSEAYYNFSPETLAEFKKAIILLEVAQIYAHRVDWLASGDDGENTFHERLKTDLERLGIPQSMVDAFCNVKH